MKFLLAGSFLLFILLSSHAGHTQNVDDQLTIISDENGMDDPGMMVGTIAIIPDGRPSGIYELLFWGKDDDWRSNSRNRILIKSRKNWKRKLRPDYWDGKKAVYVFVWKRNEGKYAFGRFSCLKGTVVWNEDLDFAFSLAHRNITYVGEIEINEQTDLITLSDQSARDLQLVRKKYPTSRWGHYKNGDIILTTP